MTLKVAIVANQEPQTLRVLNRLDHLSAAAGIVIDQEQPNLVISVGGRHLTFGLPSL